MDKTEGNRTAAAILVAALIIAGAILFAFTRPASIPERDTVPFVFAPSQVPTYAPLEPQDKYSCSSRGGVWVEDETFSWRGACVGYGS